MKPHDWLFLSRHTVMGSLSKALEYLLCYLPGTLGHPMKCMDVIELLSFWCCVLQIYLEFWNSSDPFHGARVNLPKGLV